MSTDARALVDEFDLDAGWALNPRVAVRPERFGALLYHFDTRRLSFLKDPRLLTVLHDLALRASAREACAAAGIGPLDLPLFARSLRVLSTSSMIIRRVA